jgi:hypothetical protein
MHVALRTGLSLILLTFIFVIAGCTNAPLASERTPLSGLFHPTASDPVQTFAISGPVEIDVVSFGGDVMITADPRKTEAQVRVVRRAVHGGQRRGEGKDSLDEIEYTVDLVAGEVGQKLQVRTMTAHPEPHFQRADVHITLPEVDGVHIQTRLGRVFAVGIQGKVDITTSHGDVRVLTNRRMNKPVTIVNNTGNIDFRVRGESSGLIDAQTIGGRVTYRMRYGRCIIEPGTTHNRLRARFNDGTNRITMRTVHGDIRIASMADAETVGAFIFE